MKPIVKGMFARSLAGHDKGRMYVISDVQEPYVFLVDGKIRTANRPKKKKLIHVQPDYEMGRIASSSDIMPASLAGFRLVRTITFIPMVSSGL